MVPTPMRPAQNALVIVALFLVAGALLPWWPRLQIGCAVGAAAIVMSLLVARLRAHARPGQTLDDERAQAQIERIRAARAARMGRRR